MNRILTMLLPLGFVIVFLSGCSKSSTTSNNTRQIAVSQTAVARSASDKAGDGIALQERQDKNECPEYQYKGNDGECHDKPGLTHPGHGHAPEPGEKCWDVCLCEEHLSPGPGCPPCSYQDTVCLRQ